MERMLEEQGLISAIVATTPARHSHSDEDEGKPLSDEAHQLQPLLPLRPDVAFATNRLARRLSAPTALDVWEPKRAPRHPLGTLSRALSTDVRDKTCHRLTVFTDPDGADDKLPRKAVSSEVIHVDHPLVSSGCRTNSVLSCSATRGVSEGKYIPESFRARGLNVDLLFVVDSTAAIGVASRRGRQRLWLFDVRLLWLKEACATNGIRTTKVPERQNAAEGNTKATDRKALESCRYTAGVLPRPTWGAVAALQPAL